MARVAVVGCGGWTQGWHLPNLSNRDDATIVALVDPSDQGGDSMELRAGTKNETVQCTYQLAANHLSTRR